LRPELLELAGLAASGRWLEQLLLEELGGFASCDGLLMQRTDELPEARIG
jgi:hypothetical protein